MFKLCACQEFTHWNAQIFVTVAQYQYVVFAMHTTLFHITDIALPYHVAGLLQSSATLASASCFLKFLQSNVCVIFHTSASCCSTLLGHSRAVLTNTPPTNTVSRLDR